MQIKWAKVVTVNAANKTVTVKFDDGSSSSRNYRYPKDATPSINDRACFVCTEKQIVCVGIY